MLSHPVQYFTKCINHVQYSSNYISPQYICWSVKPCTVLQQFIFLLYIFAGAVTSCTVLHQMYKPCTVFQQLYFSPIYLLVRQTLHSTSAIYISSLYICWCCQTLHRTSAIVLPLYLFAGTVKPSTILQQLYLFSIYLLVLSNSAQYFSNCTSSLYVYCCRQTLHSTTVIVSLPYIFAGALKPCTILEMILFNK